MTTYRIRLSRAANRLITGEPVMLCATAFHRQWRVIKVIDFLCFWHIRHCQVCYNYEVRVDMNYYDFILNEYRKEREMQKPSVTTCAHCNELVHQSDAVVKTYFDHTHIQQQEHYCSESCQQADYLARLNREGM